MSKTDYPKQQGLWTIIHNNEELQKFEKEGFKRGNMKGKTMDVSPLTIYESLEKQWKDLQEEWNSCRWEIEKTFASHFSTFKELKRFKRRIADLRNVAGCLFLKIQEEEAKPKIQERRDVR